MKIQNWGSILGGLLLIAAYLSLFEAVGFRAEQSQPFFHIGWQESYFWLAHYSLATPGLLLLGLGLAPWLGPATLRLGRRLTAFRPLRWRLLGLLLFAVLLMTSWLGRRHLLLDMPVTADEYGVLFGGRMVAAGHLRVPIPEPREALSLYFVYERDGFASSFDFPGGIFFSAVSLLTGTGALAYSLAAALSGLAVVSAAGHLAGRRGSLAAAAFWLLSPMVLSLSYTTHAQLLSRSFGALAIACYCRLAHRGERRLTAFAATSTGFGLGLAAGLTFLCRPIEGACLLAPAGLHLSWVALRRVSLRRAWAAAAVAWLAAAAVFAWYNVRITDLWYLQARFAPQFATKYATDQTLRELLGTNAGFNLMMLFIWLLGPPGLALVYLVLGRSTLSTVLAAGVGLQLLVGMFHPDTGIHLVGPIHYSECAVPLTLLAVLGLRRLWRGNAPLVLPSSKLAALTVAFLVSLVVFNGVHCLTLRDQARNQRVMFDAVERAGLHRAVVVAEPPYRLWDLRAEMSEVRAWVSTLPLPDPFLRDDVIFVHPYLSPEELGRHFPDRRLYRMTYHPEGESVRIEPLTAGPAANR